MYRMVRPESRHATALRGARSRFEEGIRPFLYKFYAEFFIYSECRIFIWRFYLLTYIGEVVVPVKT